LDFFAARLANPRNFPLHVWLPDAMEGPNPNFGVDPRSTMVAAGLYMLAASDSLFKRHTPRSRSRRIGTITAVLASFIATQQAGHQTAFWLIDDLALVTW